MYWPLLNMYSENFGFGPGGFFIWGTILIRGKGLGESHIAADTGMCGPWGHCWQWLLLGVSSRIGMSQSHCCAPLMGSYKGVVSRHNLAESTC